MIRILHQFMKFAKTVVWLHHVNHHLVKSGLPEFIQRLTQEKCRRRQNLRIGAALGGGFAMKSMMDAAIFIVSVQQVKCNMLIIKFEQS